MTDVRPDAADAFAACRIEAHSADDCKTRRSSRCRRSIPFALRFAHRHGARARRVARRVRPRAEEPIIAAADDGPSARAAAQHAVAGRDLQRGLRCRPLFEDQRPRNVGDILTIVIKENVNATQVVGGEYESRGQRTFAVPISPGIFGGLFNNTSLAATGVEQVHRARAARRGQHLQRHDHRHRDRRAAERQPGGERRKADAASTRATNSCASPAS